MVKYCSVALRFPSPMQPNLQLLQLDATSTILSPEKDNEVSLHN